MRRITREPCAFRRAQGRRGPRLPIAIGLIVARGELEPSLPRAFAFCGELGLKARCATSGHDRPATPLPHLSAWCALCDVRRPRSCAVRRRMAQPHWRSRARLRGDARWPRTPTRSGPAAPCTPTCPTCAPCPRPAGRGGRRGGSPHSSLIGPRVGQDHAWRALVGLSAVTRPRPSRCPHPLGAAVPAEGVLLERRPSAPHHRPHRLPRRRGELSSAQVRPAWPLQGEGMS